MRKVIILIMVCLIGCVCFVACQPKDQGELIKENMSETITDILNGENEKFTVQIVVGNREETFKLDGNSTKKRKCFVIKVFPKATTDLLSLEYKIANGDKIINGILPKSQIDGSFSADLAKNINYSNGKMELIVMENGTENKIPLASVITKDMLNFDNAIIKFQENLKDKFGEVISNGTVNAEFVLRLAKNNSGTNGNNDYYWYGAIIQNGNKSTSVLMDAKTGEVLAQK